MAVASNITKLVAYAASAYPTLPNTNTPVWFTNEFRSIAKAITSIETVAKAGQLGVTSMSGIPTTANLPAGASGVFKDTSGGGVYLVYNDAGTIKKVALV